MQYFVIFRVLGLLLMLFSGSMLPPLLIGFIQKDPVQLVFLESWFITLMTGFSLWFSFRRAYSDLKIRDGFLIVFLFWTVLSFFAAIPLFLAKQPAIGWLDAIFEATSGLTTTGASVLTDLHTLPDAVRYYRQQLQFLGGMGILVLAVAIFPMLGVGGMQLYRAEMPGPLKEAKLTPRIAETAKFLWYTYLGLTLACIVSYWLGGMTLFEAIGEGFSTISTGGFTLYDDSFAHYDSRLLEWIAIIFMFLGGANFALHFIALSKLQLSHYFDDIEFKTYLYGLLIISVIIIASLIFYELYPDNFKTISHGLFNTVSMATTTGFQASKFSQWPTFIPLLISVVAIIGGCGGSTASGLKVIRVILIYKQGHRELQRLLHPNAVLPIKFGHQVLPEAVLQAMWSFIAVFLALFTIIMLLLMVYGLDLTTAFSATIASLCNAGAGIGAIADGFGHLPPHSKWVLIFAMIAGRLEIFPVLILLTPAFWRG